MTIRYMVTEHDQYLLFTGEGIEADLKANIEIHNMIVNLCKDRNCHRVLIDDSRVIYTASISALYSLAKHYSEVDVPRFVHRAAVIANPRYRPDNRFFEDAMQNRNINLRVFYDMENAKKWLLT